MNSIFHWLCNPVFLFVMLLAIAAGLRVLRRTRASAVVLWIALGWMVLLGSTPLPQWMIFSLERHYKAFEVPEAAQAAPQLVLILGGGHTIAPDLPAGLQLSTTAMVRLAEGMRVRQLLGGGTLICSGSSATLRTTQAEVLALAAVEMGVQKEDTVQLRQGRRTEEELVAYQKRFGNAPVIVVTSARHLPRVMMHCRKLGIEAVPAPAEFLLKKDPQVSRFEFYPSVNKLLMTEAALHEYLGIAALWFKDLGS